jgi:hypothetical protein
MQITTEFETFRHKVDNVAAVIDAEIQEEQIVCFEAYATFGVVPTGVEPVCVLPLPEDVDEDLLRKLIDEINEIDDDSYARE